MRRTRKVTLPPAPRPAGRDGTAPPARTPKRKLMQAARAGKAACWNSPHTFTPVPEAERT